MTGRILVADDSTEWSKSFCGFLSRMKYQAESVATGAELRDAITTRPDDYDVLIVDNSMPEEHGEEEIPYCGVRNLGRLVSHFWDQGKAPPILAHVIVRSIYSKSDLDVLRQQDDAETKEGCERVAKWFDRNVTLDDLMSAITELIGDMRRRR
jgi:hypothetical protein